jgi:hypothetical protein
MSSFFVSSDKIKVGQTEVSVPAENGMNFGPGGKIDISVPPTSKFVDLSQTRLKFDVTLSLPTITATSGACRLQLDAETGLHSLIRSVRIFTGGAGRVLLEEIEGYDILTALRFDYETNQNLVNKRSLTEGATVYDPACRGSRGTTKSDCANCFSNPYFSKKENNTTETASFTAAAANDFQVVKGELHLNTGLFRNSAVFPSVLTDGLFVEILLRDAQTVFRQLDSTLAYRRLPLNPWLDSLNGSDAVPTAWAAGASGISEFYMENAINNQTSLGTFPFVVGQHVTFATEDYDGSSGSLMNNTAVISQIEQVTGTAYGVSKTKVTTATNMTNSTGVTSSAVSFMMVSATPEDATTFNPTYTVSNVELLVEQIQVPDGYERSMMGMMKEGGTINYDYRSWTNYKYSQVASDLVTNIRLPLIESRATAILCIPTDATVYSSKQALSCSNTYLINTETNDTSNRSNRSGLVGICDELQNYQLIYDGKINPSRKVDVSKISGRTSISQQWCIEAEKALAMSDIEPLSFLAFQNNFFIGRALALGSNAVYDARGRDFNLQCEYTGSTAPAKNKLWNNYVSHIRRLVIKNGSVSVQV